MSPAVKTALAYCRVTGELPSHIHLSTWSVAYRMLEKEPYTLGGIELHRNVLNEEAKAATDNHPMWLAVQYLKAKGFVFVGRRRNTSHYIPMRHLKEEWTALAYRSGGGSITRVLRDENGKFIRNETTYFSEEETRP